MKNIKLQSEKIDVLVYGSRAQQFIDQMVFSIKQKETDYFTKEELKSRKKMSLDKQQQLRKEKDKIFQNDQTNVYKNYNKNIKKLLNLKDFTEQSDQIKSSYSPSSLSGHAFNNSQISNNNINAGKKYHINQRCLSLQPFRKYSSTISTEQFWFTFNFTMISDAIIDPYISTFITGPFSIIILAFDNENKIDKQNIQYLFTKFCTYQSQSSLKYRSQMILLQNGQTVSYNDNIIMAHCELPDIEQIGITLLVGFGKDNSQLDQINFQDERQFSKYIQMDIGSIQDNITECYKWIIQSYYINKSKIILSPEVMNALTQAIRCCQKYQQKILKQQKSPSLISAIKRFSLKGIIKAIMNLITQPKNSEQTINNSLPNQRISINKKVAVGGQQQSAANQYNISNKKSINEKLQSEQQQTMNTEQSNQNKRNEGTNVNSSEASKNTTQNDQVASNNEEEQEKQKEEHQNLNDSTNGSSPLLKQSITQQQSQSLSQQPQQQQSQQQQQSEQSQLQQQQQQQQPQLIDQVSQPQLTEQQQNNSNSQVKPGEQVQSTKEEDNAKESKSKEPDIVKQQ